MGRLIYREFLKALPRKIWPWMIVVSFGLLVVTLVFQAGDIYMFHLRSASRALDLTTAERVQEFMELAPARHPLKGMALVLSPRLALLHGLALLFSMGSLAELWVAILSAKLFGDEYAHGTIRRMWTEGYPKVLHVAAKLVAICLIALVAIAFTCLVAVVLTPVVRWFYPIPWVPGGEFPSLGQLGGRFALQLLISLAFVLFLALFAGTIAAAARNTFAGVIAVMTYRMFSPEALLPQRLQPLFPDWHVRTLRALAFPEFAVEPWQPVTVQMGNRIWTIYTQQEFLALVGFELPQMGPEPSLAVSLTVLGAYLLLLTAILHVVWHRQETQ